MSAQQAPHAPPLWRRFLSLPRTRLGWLAVGLAAIALVRIATSGFGVGFVFVDNGVGVLAAVVSFVLAVIAFVRDDDLSVLVWAATLPGALVISGVFVLLLFAISI